MAAAYGQYGSPVLSLIVALVPLLLFHSHVKGLGIKEEDARKAQHALERGVAQEAERRKIAHALA